MARLKGFTNRRVSRLGGRRWLRIATSLSAALISLGLALTIEAVRFPAPPTRPTTKEVAATNTMASVVAARNRSTRIDHAPTTVNGYITRGYTDISGATMMYYLHVPPGVNDINGIMTAAAQYPVVLMLQGGGERAYPKASLAANRALLLNAPYIRLWTSAMVQATYPCFVIVPQVMGTKTQWVNTSVHKGSYTLAQQPAITLRLANDILAQVLSDYRGVINPSRVYITGISMGAYGVWDAIERWPQEFAAAAPVSGAGDPALAGRVTHLPLWVFHSTSDGIIPVSGSRDMVAAITKLGGHPRYTESSSANHDIWVSVYSNPVFLAWLFAQRSSI